MHVRITSALWRDNINTVEGYLQYMWGTASVMWGIARQYCGGYLQYCGRCSVQWGITSVQWGKLQYCGGYLYMGYLQYMQGDNISTVGDNISNVEGIQYSGGRFLISACLGH